MVFEPDADPNEAQWLRTREQLFTPDDRPIKTREDLLATITDLGMTEEEFKKLPIARHFEDLLK